MCSLTLNEAAEGSTISDEALAERRSARVAADLATIIYTSGTTGRPKGCELTHANMLADVRNAIGALPEIFTMSGRAALLFLPLARVVADLGLQNSMWSLVLVYPTFTIPFCTWLLMGFFKALPPEIEEAAIVDGCSLFGAFVKMALPLSLPGILTVVIFTFTLTLQEFVYALTFISSSAQKPITLGVATDLIRGDIFFWGEIMAGALIASIPVAIAYNFFLDRFIAGITGGAVK
jgi:ABC-type glycerol-3-phosphate transport system permease component